MKLQDLAASSPARHAAKVFESYFGTRVSFDQLTTGQARQLLTRVRQLIREHKQTVSHHFSEHDPAYLKLVVMETALSGRVREEAVPIVGAATRPQTSATTTAAKPTAASTTANKTSVDVKDPKLAAALKKSQGGQTLTPDEQKLVAGAALMQQESRLKRAYRMLRESEVQQAQVVLAAQDLVDKMQSMLEDTTEMQFKELPALVDSIRNQIGMDQANQFNTDATAALTGLVQNLQGAKQQMEAALGVVTGQQQATPALDAAMGAGDMAAPQPPGDGSMDLSVGADLDIEEPPEPEQPPAAGKGALGRARR
jgi:hypothetical protein